MVSVALKKVKSLNYFMQYTISYSNPTRHFVDIILTINNINKAETILQLPSWRPGRYELGDFIQNIQKFNVTDPDDHLLEFTKTGKDQWKVNTRQVSGIKVVYNYYAFKMDAGSSWLDENQLYLNFINCLIFDPDLLSKSCMVRLKLPENYKIACGLVEVQKHELKAENFYHLVESPMIASAQLRSYQYTCGDCNFYLWFMGNYPIHWEKIRKDFFAFTENQINMMGVFPCKKYHFLFQLLPYKCYHGVEHFNSTVIAFGPGQLINEGSLYEDLLGVSSHELFHTWNAIRIKPQEFIPYDFSRENYFETGFVAEGFTTYYGDIFLVRSNVFDENWYLNELNKQLNRHLNNLGRLNLSLVDSSYDLWIDGYQKGIPDRKVSIYTKGALVAFLFDLKIRQVTANQNSLDDVLIKMWSKYGDTKNGYSSNDILNLINEVAGELLDDMFNDLIYRTTPIEICLKELLPYIGCELTENITDNLFEYQFGFKGIQEKDRFIITRLFPGSVAAMRLSVKDEIVAINGERSTLPLQNLIGDQSGITISFFRNNKLLETSLTAGDEKYFIDYKISKTDLPGTDGINNFNLWLQNL